MSATEMSCSRVQSARAVERKWREVTMLSRAPKPLLKANILKWKREWDEARKKMYA